MATLEQLEDDVWPEPKAPTRLLATCHRLRKKEIAKFSIEDMRILVGQGIGLAHLVPLVLAMLERDSLAAGDFYPGDLLQALTRNSNWQAIEGWSSRVEAICRDAIARLPADSPASEIDGERGLPLERVLANNFHTYLNRRSHAH
jgi:CDI immunity proteins